MTGTYQITFPQQALGRANTSVTELISSVPKHTPGVSMRPVKADEDTQDVGAVLQIVLNASAIASVASGIATWLGRNSGARIQITLPDGTSVDVKHSGEDTAAVVGAVFHRSLPTE